MFFRFFLVFPMRCNYNSIIVVQTSRRRQSDSRRPQSDSIMSAVLPPMDAEEEKDDNIRCYAGQTSTLVDKQDGLVKKCGVFFVVTKTKEMIRQRPNASAKV